MDDEIPEDRPSLAVSIALLSIGFLMLAPFVLLALLGGPMFNPFASLTALFTVGWGVFVGIALVVVGWQRLKKWRALAPDAGKD